MTNIVANGIGFLVNEDGSPVNEFQLVFSDYDGGPEQLFGTIAYNPAGAQAIYNPGLPSTVINEWSDTKIDIDYEPSELGFNPDAHFVAAIRLVDENVNFYYFNIDPDQPQSIVPVINAVVVTP